MRIRVPRFGALGRAAPSAGPPKRRWATVAFLVPPLVAACGDGGEAPWPPPPFELDSASFVVTAYEEGDPELFLVRNRFDTLWARVTDRPGLDNSATWSPDGEWVVFHSDRSSADSLDLDLFLVNPEGRVPPVPLTSDPAFDYLPSYSPDGRYLAFLSRRAESPRESEGDAAARAHIYLLEVVGRTVHRVTRTPVNASLGASWMPDGQSLLIARREGEDGPTALVRVTLDLGAPADRPMGTREEVLVADSLFNYTPAASPDGRRIAYTAESSEAARVVVLDLETGERTVLTDAGFHYVDTWTPDGEWVAVTRWDPAQGRREIWLLDPDGELPEMPLLAATNRSASDVAFRPVVRP